MALEPKEFAEKAKRIELLLLDVDGVLTDGSIVLDSRGEEIKRFSVRDGFAIKSWQRSGKKVAVISGRFSQAVAYRCQELGIAPVMQKNPNKIPAYRELLRSLNLVPEQVCAIGDDLPDLPLLLASGLGATVADGEAAVRERADFVCQRPGGQGAVRELIEALMAAQGNWDSVVEHYARAAEL